MNDALGSVQSVLILGGGSDIALATAKAMVAQRCRTVILAGRDPESFSGVTKELQRAGATTVETVEFDALDHASHPDFVRRTFERFGDIDLVFVAFGVLGDQDRAEHDPTEAIRILDTNFVGAVSVLVPAHGRAPAPGARHDRGAVIRRRGAGPEVELRVRLQQGRARCLLSGTR